jgi:hypothetical protein
MVSHAKEGPLLYVHVRRDYTRESFKYEYGGGKCKITACF